MPRVFDMVESEREVGDAKVGSTAFTGEIDTRTPVVEMSLAEPGMNQEIGRVGQLEIVFGGEQACEVVVARIESIPEVLESDSNFRFH